MKQGLLAILGGCVLMLAGILSAKGVIAAGTPAAQMRSAETSPAAASAQVSFKRDIVPLLKSRCVACHLTGQEPGNMALHPAAAYQALVGVKSIESPLLRVKPGAPDESYIVRKLEGTHLEAGGLGLRMPLEGGPLSAAEIQRVRDWIQSGAPQE